MKSQDSSAKPSPVVLVAFFCAMASVGIAALAFCLNREMSALFLISTAFMVACPAAMGVGIAKFMLQDPTRADRD